MTGLDVELRKGFLRHLAPSASQIFYRRFRIGDLVIRDSKAAMTSSGRKHFGVRRIPALLLFVDGKLKESFIGTADLEALGEALEGERSAQPAVIQ